MKFMVSLYDQVLAWAEHQYAPRYLAALSFAESMFFPVPPDFMLAPMVLAKPLNAYRFALLTTLASVLGGIIGYCLGCYAFQPIVVPFLEQYGYYSAFEVVMNWFNAWGFWAILIAGFTPIPYKIFTIGAGVMNFNLLLFIGASVIARGSRFLLVSALLKYGGEQMSRHIRMIIDRMGWAFVALFLGMVVYYYVR